MREPSLADGLGHAVRHEDLAQQLLPPREVATHDAVWAVRGAKRAALVDDRSAEMRGGVLVLHLAQPRLIDAGEEEPDHRVGDDPVDEVGDDRAEALFAELIEVAGIGHHRSHRAARDSTQRGRTLWYSAPVRRVPLFAIVLSLGLLSLGCGGATTIATVVTAEPVALDPQAVTEYQAGLHELQRPSRAAERRAREHFEAALAADPNIWEASYCLGVLQRRAGELREAAASFEAARALAPTSEQVLIALAETRYALGESDAAAQLLQGYVASAPDDIAARVSLATILRERGDYDGALTQAREVLIRQPSSARALAEVGRVYRARQQYDVAELVLRKALDLGETAELHNDMGLLELARGDTQAAFGEFDRAIALDATYSPAHLNQGSVLLHAGDYEGAEAHYRAVLQAHEDDLDARVALAIALRGRGEHAAAQREYERVLEAAPNHAAALYDLGVLLAEFRDQRPRAREIFQHYLEVAPGSAPQRETAQHYVQDIGAEMAPRTDSPRSDS